MEAQYLTPNDINVRKNAAAVTENAQIEMKLQPELYPTSGQKLNPVIVIQSAAPEVRAKYVALPDSPKRRKLVERDLDENVNTTSKDIEQLQELLQEVFEAEDNYQPDTSMLVAKHSSALFDPQLVNEDGSPRISISGHARLQAAIQKVTRKDKLLAIPIDYWKRLLRLCEEPILSIETVNVEPSRDPSEDQVSYWKQQLRVVENSMAAASTFMSFVLGALREKELFPAEVSSKLPMFLQKVLEDLLIPVAELRPSGKTAASFTAARSVKDILQRLAGQSTTFLDIFSSLHMRMKDTDLAINSIVALGPKLIAVENASADKDSVIGNQRFESLRKVGMGVLAKVFAKYQDQQHSIIEGLLDSLNKLPTGKQGARQYRLAHKSIQLVSALFMQLVQATAVSQPLPEDVSGKRKSMYPRRSRSVNGEDEDDNDTSDEEDELSSRDLQKIAKPRISSAHINARRIMQGFLKRAVDSKKHGDDKHRNLLDLFIEDMINVIALVEWPAAEILLRSLTSDLFYSITGKLIIDGEECVLQTNTALEILGWIASALLNVRAALGRSIAEPDDDGNEASHNLRLLAEDQLSAGLRPEDILTAEGPYRIAVEYLQKYSHDDLHHESARTLCTVQWAEAVITHSEKSKAETSGFNKVSTLLEDMLLDPRFLETNAKLEEVNFAQARIAYILVILNSGLGKYFDHIIRLLISSIGSDQVKTRARALKCMESLLETDSKLLDKEPGIMKAIFLCTTDSSPMVRDSALSLIGTYISITPKLLGEGCVALFRCSSDPSVGVRKKCLNLLKDVYRLTERHDLQIAISDMVLQRITDTEDSVSKLAQQTLEELWFGNLKNVLKGDDTDDKARIKVAVSEHTNVIVRALQRSEQNSGLFESFLHVLFKDNTKTSAALEKCCKALVNDSFDKAVSLASDRGSRQVELLLQLLTVFAKARPKLIDSVRLEALLPYLSNLGAKQAGEGGKSDDLALFQYAVAIFHSVIPFTTAVEKPLLNTVQLKLFEVISQLPKAVLDEVTSCLWTIHGILQGTERFVRFAFSVLKKGLEARNSPVNDEKQMQKLRTLLRLLGSVGKNWDLEDRFPIFKKAYPTTTETSVAGMFVDFVVPFTTAGQQLHLRAVALDSLGSICQSWPGQFNKPPVQQSLSQVFSENHADLQDIVLRIFSGFFGIREKSIDTIGSKKDQGETQDEDLGRLASSLKASQHDGAAALIGAHFIKPMLKVATSSLDSSALTAIRVIASISRQGLLHPKECAGAFVALGTSPNAEIAKVAVDTHRTVHQQHETMMEREYMRALQETFIYQKEIIGDINGASARPYVPKLRNLFDIVKMSNARYVKKFLSGLIQKSSFDPAKMDSSGNPPNQVLFTRFIMHNLAFFEYARMEDLLHVIGHMEGVIGKLGVDIAQNIEAQILRTAMTLLPGQTEPVDPFRGEDSRAQSEPEPVQVPTPQDQRPVDLEALRRLTTAAMLLSIIYETRSHLKRQYGIARAHLPNGAKKDTKEMAKAPTKAHFVTGERYWEAVKAITGAMDSEDSMKARCQHFVTLMNIDEEVRVAGDDADDRLSFSESLDLEDSVMNTPSGRKSNPRKRKSSVSLAGTPKKKRGRPRKSATAHSDDGDSDGVWE